MVEHKFKAIKVILIDFPIKCTLDCGFYFVFLLKKLPIRKNISSVHYDLLWSEMEWRWMDFHR